MGILLTNGDSFTQGDELPGSRRVDEYGNVLKGVHHHLTFSYKLAELLGVNYVNLGQNGSSNQKIFRRTTTHLQKTSQQIDYMVLTWSSWGRVEVVTDFHPDEDKLMYIHQECNMNQIIPDHYSRSMSFALRHWNIRDSDRLIDPIDIMARDEERVYQSAAGWFKHVYNMATPILHHLNYMTIMQDFCDARGIKIVQGIIHPDLWENVKRVLTLKERFPHAVEEIKWYLKYLRPECKVGMGDGMDMTSIARRDDNDFFIYPKGHPCEGTHEYYANHLYSLFQGMKNATD